MPARQPRPEPTAVVVGAGPNGLAAAIQLARNGVDVQVLEAAETVGGGARSGELTVPGVIHDYCSAFHPMGVGSPFWAELDLSRYGLTWLWPEIDCAHPLDDGTAGVAYRSIDRTAAGLGADGARWRRLLGDLVAGFDDLGQDLLRPVLGVPHHPIRLAGFGARAVLPATVVGWFSAGESMRWLKDIASTLTPGQPIYVMLYASAIVFFCFFYTALVFNSRETADNLKKSGAFVPGIRPGEQTAKYIDKILARLTLAGALYITFVCLLPEFLILKYNVPFYFGGTSLLIIVVVTMDFMAQVQNYLMSQQYESLLKKANFKTSLGG